MKIDTSLQVNRHAFHCVSL